MNFERTWTTGPANVFGFWARALGYWCIVLAERAAGTPAGDWFASRRGLGLGLPIALLCVGAGLIAALWLYQRTKRQG
jgi:uncharacterized membrane-anchored protein